MPAIDTPLSSANAVLGTVSVVMIARDTSGNALARRDSFNAGKAPVILHGSSSTPITPVEAGNTS